MPYKRRHLLEKLQVELAAGAALAVMYLAVGPVLGWWDPEWPTTFVPSGAFAQMAGFAATVWILAAACALVTVSSRPEGALLATLVGAAGVSLHSSPIRTIFWQHEGALGLLFGMLIAEVLLLVVVLLVAEMVVFVVRTGVARWKPGWMWRGRVGPSGPSARAHGDSEPGAGLTLGGGLLRTILARKRLPGATGGRVGVVSVSCLGVSVLIGAILLMLLMQSSHRGQVVFSLFVSFLLAVMIAHQKFPTPFGAAAWISPILTAIVFYLLAAGASMETVPNSWTHVPFYARALPVDWMAAGGAGAVLGFWISERIHELRHMENESTE